MEFSKLNSERRKHAKSIKIVKSDRLKGSVERDGKVSFLPQFIACICAFTIIIDYSVINAWTSPALPYLKSNQTEFPVSDSQGAWIAALPNLSAIIGILIFPLFIDKIGRRYTMLIFGTLHGISTVLIILAKSYMHLYAARIIGGIGCGGGYSTTVVYIGEIANKEFRGTIMTILHIFAKASNLLVAVAGAYLQYHTMNLTLLSVSILFILFFFLMPETPYFDLMKGKDTRAVKTLMKLKGVNNPEDVMVDIQRIKKGILENELCEKKIWREMFCKNGCRRSLMVVLLAFAVVIYSGHIAIGAYAQEILHESGSTLEPTDAAMILAGMNVIAILPTTLFIDRFRRRPLFLVSGILSGILMGIVSLYFFLKLYIRFDVSSFSWLPLIGLISFEFACYMGFAILPMVFSSELFPLSVKVTAIAFVNIFQALLNFTVKLAYQALKSAGGIYVPFFTFSACCICGSCVVFWVAPETKGKSLEEIQDMLRTKKSKPVNLIQDTVVGD